MTTIRTGINTLRAAAGLLLMIGLTLALMTGLVSKPAEAAPTPGTPSGSVQFVDDSLVVTEGNLVTVEIERVGGSVGAVQASITTADGSATAGSDYAGVAGPLPLSWPDGDTATRSVSLPITPDVFVEGDETFTVLLTSAHAGSPTTVTVTIEDAPNGVVQFVDDSLVVTEGNLVTVEIERVGGSAGAVQASIMTADGSATAGSDYAGVGLPLPLSWPDGNATTRTVSLPITPDVFVEGDETFTVLLTSAHAGSPTTVTVTIEDAPNGVVQFVDDSLVVTEGGLVTVEIERAGGSAGAIQASITTADGSATAGSDYAGVGVPLLLSWPDGNATTRTVALPILADGVDELDETFTVLLASAHAGSPTTATVTIVGTAPVTPTPTSTATPVVDPTPTPTSTTTPPVDPTPTPTPTSTATPPVDPTPTAEATPTPTAPPVRPPTGIIEFAQAGYTVTEAQCSVTVELKRVLGDHGNVSVTLGTAAGTAQANVDFEAMHAAIPVKVMWAHGETASKFVTINIVNDGIYEADETFNVVMLETVGAGRGSDATAIVITETPVAGSESDSTQTGCGAVRDSADPAVSRRVAASSSAGAEGSALPLSAGLAVGGVVTALGAVVARTRRTEPIVF